ncbi:MAG: hypothetical protein ISR48_05255 [Alphaproteobacteria bacterium]|nr:hypothetical protein [Alphaproteobacteria bacterium]
MDIALGMLEISNAVESVPAFPAHLFLAAGLGNIEDFLAHAPGCDPKALVIFSPVLKDRTELFLTPKRLTGGGRDTGISGYYIGV